MESISSGAVTPEPLIITRQELYNIMKNSNCKGLDSQIEFLRQTIKSRVKCSLPFENNFDDKITQFKAKFKSHWEKARRIEARFLKNNDNWLKTSVRFAYKSSSNTKRGRPNISFEEGSERTKRYKTEQLRRSTSASELVYATEMSLRASGQSGTARLIREITTLPTQVQKCRNALKEIN